MKSNNHLGCVFQNEELLHATEMPQRFHKAASCREAEDVLSMLGGHDIYEL